MNIPSASRRFEHRARGSFSFLLSLTAHVVLLLVLASWSLIAGSNSHGILIVASEGDSADAFQDLAPLSNPEMPNDNDLEQLPELELPNSSLTNNPFVLRAPEVFVASSEQSLATASLTSASISGAATSLDTRGFGRGATFFGTYAKGGRFVYVIDSSQSMKEGRDGSRWLVARQKLIESLKSLGREQEFFVICFDAETSLLFNVSPQAIEFKRVNDVVIDRVSRWLRSRTLGPATMPAKALQTALSMQPDAIFLLSDGEIQDNTLEMLRLTNIESAGKKQVPIHAIHLMSEVGRETLEILAEDNGGTFRHVAK